MASPSQLDVHHGQLSLHLNCMAFGIVRLMLYVGLLFWKGFYHLSTPPRAFQSQLQLAPAYVHEITLDYLGLRATTLHKYDIQPSFHLLARSDRRPN